MFSKRILQIVVLVAPLSISVHAEDRSNEGKSNASKTPSIDSPSANNEVDQLRRELEALRDEMAAKDAELEEMSKAQDARIEELDRAIMSTTAEERFKLYGFFSLTFTRDFPDEDSMLNGLAPEKTSFVIPSFNLYLRSEMTETLTTLAELRFTFLPHGAEKDLELAGVSEYERVDNTFVYQHIYKEIRIGGVGIERLHLTWQPRDWFGVLAGYFLTPYGIWNIDHGTPVLIPVREPFMQYSELVPLHQLGLQIFGRVWPAQRVSLDYAVTFSNGRGPVDTVQDLDENKGLGLRLRLLAEGDEYTIGLGGYGYYGDYTDLKKVITSVTPQFTVEQQITNSYSELIGALDLLIETHGVRVQSEYARRLNRYSEHRPERSVMSGVMGGYQPDYINQSVYVLLAWTLPLHQWLMQMTLTPYFEVDYSYADDTIEGAEAIIILGGLNFKPSPYVVLKAEGGMVNSINSSQLDLSYVSGQMAVSF